MRSYHSSPLGGVLVLAGGILLSSCGAQKTYTARQKEIAHQLQTTIVSDYRVMEKFNPAELRALAAEPKKDPRRLMFLINRAGVEKDASFRDLPARADLRSSDTGVYLALLGYDYSVNGNKTSLDKLLHRLTTEPQGGDSGTVLALSFMDEWERSPAAVKHFYRRTDGAGGLSRVMFWQRREFYFPEHYQQYQQTHP